MLKNGNSQLVLSHILYFNYRPPDVTNKIEENRVDLQIYIDVLNPNYVAN